MKEWSKTWKASKLPKKQRKYVYNLPAHLKGKIFSSHLSKDLRKKYGMRNIRVRKGDKVKVMRGQNSGRTGTVESVDTKYVKVYITGIELTKRDGSKTKQPVHPSNLLIQELDTTDKRRFVKEQKTKTDSSTQVQNTNKTNAPKEKIQKQVKVTKQTTTQSEAKK